ncbi:ATP-binding protein [Fortiea contorta]|uniref:ATP-binding protein n=1 Tax=Fortiea contorta TaxID=1892405 RepID=UPI00034B764D|nr:ATP-binding protein [Fortiea contorta]
MLTLTTNDQRWVGLNFSTPVQLIGRSAEFEHIVEVLAQDGDLLITGVPGSGRRTLVRNAAQEAGARVLEIDCIRATDGKRFVQLLAAEINQNWHSVQLQNWIERNASEFLSFEPEGKLKPWPNLGENEIWRTFEILLDLLQIMAVALNQRVVVILHSFPHIRSWDRYGLWEVTLRRDIKAQTHVSYVLIATIAETNYQDENNYPLETLQLPPLDRDVLALWAREVLHTQQLKFDSRSTALQLFLDAVQGHIGDAIALIRRLQTLCHAQELITPKEVEQAITELLKDLSITFESLLMLLPANQVHLLESLALDPTEKPQSKEYIQKHGLSRGGSLQGALTGLQHKGLIYGAEQGYQPALPLFALWLKRRLS